MSRKRGIAPVRASLGALLLLALPLLLFRATGAWAREFGLVDGLWVMGRAEDRYKGNDRTEKLTITVYRDHRPDKKRVMSVLWLEKRYGRGEDRIVVHFVRPADVAGTNLLMHTLPFKDDDRWLYYPQDNIFRRIRARDRNSNFMGTDFTYQDLAEREPEEDTHKLLRIEEYEGVPCYVVESVPKDRRDAGYGKTVTWVEKNHFVKVKIEYWDLGGRHLKTYKADRIVDVDGVKFPTRLTMRTDHSRQNTIVERGEISLNVGLKDDLFQPQRLANHPYENLFTKGDRGATKP